jgi:hypothetical protein
MKTRLGRFFLCRVLGHLWRVEEAWCDGILFGIRQCQRCGKVEGAEVIAWNRAIRRSHARRNGRPEV